MPSLELRQYDPADADVVWDLHERALRDIGAFDPEYAHLDEDLRRVREAYVEAGGEFLVGELAGEDAVAADGDDAPSTPDPGIVAMGGLQPASVVDHHDSDDAGVIRRMRVDPAHQRRGFGSALLAALEERAPELGFDRLVLDTTPRQAAAMALYESFGYEETRRESTPAGEMVFYEKFIFE